MSKHPAEDDLIPFVDPVYTIEDWPMFLGVLLVFAAIFLVVNYSASVLYFTTATLKTAASSTAGKAIGTASAAALAAVLYRLKVKARLVYGLIELLCSMLLVWHSFSQTDPSHLSSALLLIIAGCYLMVSALENMGEGRRRLRRGKVATA